MKSVYLFLVALSFLAPIAAAQNGLEAVVETVKGTVDVHLPGKAEWEPAKKGMKLPEGSEIFTGSDGACELGFEKIGVASIGALTHASVDKYLVSKVEAKARLKVEIGDVRVKVRKVDLETDFTIETPHLTAAVKGSETGANVNEDDSSLQQFEGSANATGSGGGSLNLSAGDGTDGNMTMSINYQQQSGFLNYQQDLATNQEQQFTYQQTGTFSSNPSNETNPGGTGSAGRSTSGSGSADNPPQGEQPCPPGQ